MLLSPANDSTVDRPLIVGVGASAGGLAAFKTFLTHMPANSGMAFVLVQHLDPDHTSLLVELLRPNTAMPVVEAANQLTVQSNHIYVIPPNATLTLEGGSLRLIKPAPARQFRRPIDTFFCSLAEDAGERAVAIVLSGVGSDGSLGVRAVKEHGGLALAQAEFDHEALLGMPSSAAATGLVDHVVPIEAMPDKLIEYQRHLNDVANRKDGDGICQDTRDHLPQLTNLLRTRTGHDFRGYKEATVARRIQRRMQVLHVDGVAAYLEMLNTEPEELDRLFAELLIGVTEFFRDPAAFEALAVEVLAKIVAGRDPDDQVRIWVPGCATGEEAYSIAIALREANEYRRDTKVVIFGTDIDASAIALARTAHFPKQPPGLSDERFQRWFVKDGAHYCPIKEIRDQCVFSVHSVIKDPPFSRLDLISCRNLLIYLNSDIQRRALDAFHYALRPNGYLFLGPSESVTREAKQFSIVDRKHRILQRRDVPRRAPELPRSMPRGEPVGSTSHQRPTGEDAIDKRARRALEPYSPAYFVIDASNDIVRFSGPETGHYLEPTSGAASFALFGILRKNLRHAVRAAVKDARTQKRSVVNSKLKVRIEGRTRSVTLIVDPIGAGSEQGMCVVAFRDIGSEDVPIAAAATVRGDGNVEALEQELHETKAQLQDAILDLERHVEEAKSATEEYQSVNEELQSANEELETSKEEMQSVNEELQTINAELYSKNDVLTRLNSDVQNLIDSTRIAIIFLDQELRIKNYTPAIADIFPLREGDRGRPLGQIVSHLVETDLTDDLTKVQRSLATIEREMQIKRDSQVLTLLMRARPYRTVDNRIEGVVVTFVDINAMTQANAERARYAALAQASGDAILGLDLDGTVTSWSPGAETLLGYSAQEMIGRNISILAPEGSQTEHRDMLEMIKIGGEVTPVDTVRRHKNGQLVPVSLRAAPVFSAGRVPVGISSTLRDISGRKKAEQQEALLNRELSHRVKNSLAVIQALAHHTLRSTPDPQKFTEAFQGRLQALASAHEMLTHSNWAGADFGGLAREQLAPFTSDDGSRLQLDGPSVLLHPETATSLALVVHELATNASKHGALSAPAGSVSLSWHVTEGPPPLLHIEWRERGGPPVKSPTSRGFGSQLIERSGVVVEQKFHPAGLVTNIEVALFGEPGAEMT